MLIKCCKDAARIRTYALILSVKLRTYAFAGRTKLAISGEVDMEKCVA